MTKNVQSLKNWFPILNWEELPNLGGCQNLEYDEFMRNYYVNDKLQSKLDSLITHLDSDYSNKSDSRFIGNPGTGKTTFLYWIMKLAESGQNPALERYTFYIFHANHANSEDYEEQIKNEILHAWESLYTQSGKKEVFDQIDLQQEISVKSKLNKLSRYFKINRADFSKLLIFIVDDVDLLSNDLIYNILISIKSNLELIQAMIWISIRSGTIHKYEIKTRDLLLEMFSDSWPLDYVPLSKIIQKRVEAISDGLAKNPFSERLSDDLLYELFQDNKRLSLMILSKILSENLPKGIHLNADESFIQNYIEKGAIKTFLKHELITNIHIRSLRTPIKYPLPFDIIGCLVHTSDKNIVLGAVNEIAITRSRSSSIRGRKLVINPSDYISTIPRLEHEGLIESKGGELLLTNTGRLLSKRITNPNLSDYYNMKCKELLQNEDNDELYWELLKPHINYKEVVETLISWKDFYAK